MTESQFESEISNGKNKRYICCTFCNSVMLSKLQGSYLKQEKEINLPTFHMKNTKDLSTITTEPMTDFWTVGDMFEFENMGFSNPVNNLRYLACADCDMGPVGYQEEGANKTCYVSLCRVKHLDEVL